MNTNTPRYDSVRQRLDKITTWILFGTLTFKSPTSERIRIQTFQKTIKNLETRLHLQRGELRWVLSQQGDHATKRYHFHVLLDGSNLPNVDPTNLASNFAKHWVKSGGGNAEVVLHTIQRGEDGFQKSVNYVCKVEGFTVPHSAYFNAGNDAQIRLSESLQKHLAEVCATAEDNQKE